MRAAIAALVVITALAVAAVAAPVVFLTENQPTVMQAPSGDLIYKRGTMTIRLTEQPCGFQGLERILEEEGIPPVHAYVMVQEGRPQVRGCWVRAAYDDDVLIEDIGGGSSFMPLSWFKTDPGV
jgi:hypothetical protein